MITNIIIYFYFNSYYNNNNNIFCQKKKKCSYSSLNKKIFIHLFNKINNLFYFKLINLFLKITVIRLSTLNLSHILIL